MRETSTGVLQLCTAERLGPHQGGGAPHNLALCIVLRSVAWAHELVLILRSQPDPVITNSSFETNCTIDKLMMLARACPFNELLVTNKVP